MTPRRPSSPAARSNSASAASGTCHGKQAKPARRCGWRAQAAASSSLQARAAATPTSGSSSSGPGMLTLITLTSMPAASMARSLVATE